MKKFTYGLLLMLLFSTTNLSAQNVSLDFDGQDDEVTTTFPGVTGSADRTFEAWIYVNASAPSSNLAILDYGLNASGSRNTFMVNSSRGIGFISGGTNANLSSTPSIIVDNQWTHVAFVLDNGTGYMYVNGVQVGTGSLTSVNTPTGNSNMIIGERVSGGSIPFNGRIDEVRIWDVARTQTEIMNNMNAELCQIPSSLKAYYRFNDGIINGANASNTSAFDDAGNSYTGTLANFALTGTTSNWVGGTVLGAGINDSLLVVNTCSSYTSNGGTTYTASGVYSETYTNVAGCDSILALDITITPITSTINANACVSYTTPSGNNTYTISGLYTDTIPAANGCDSIITISLSIDGYNGTQIISACDQYTTPDGSNTWNVSGQYQVTYTGTTGCDSTVNYVLTIESGSSATISETVCGSYTSPSGQVFTSSGTYQDIIPNAVGCDSTITINLTVITVDNTVTLSDLTLTASQAGATYQWYSCSDGLPITPLAGETSQSFTPSAQGDYSVEITDNNCTVMSACFTVGAVSLEESTLPTMTIYPNPSDGPFTISFNESNVDISLTIVDLQGKAIFRTQTNASKTLVIDENLANGVYFVQLQAGDALTTHKVIINH